MIEIGKRQTLTMVKKTDFGAYLADTSDKEKRNEEVLLPKKEVPFDLEVWDPIEVFVYRDSKDRLIATVREPKITLGQTERLEVKEVTPIGAFLDWGLEKDLLLPFREQKGRPEVGEVVCVSLYVDKSGRLCATMWVSDEMKKQSSYEKNADRLLRLLKKEGRKLAIGDKSSPEDIKEITGMSKNEFKKAAGSLYKQRIVEIADYEIKLK